MNLSLRLFIPPIVYHCYSYILSKLKPEKKLHSTPSIITSGPLKGKKIIVETLSSWKDDMQNGIYDKAVIEYLCSEYNFKNKTVLDIGGHYGYYTLLFAEKVEENGKVIVLEPDQTNLSYLNKNVELNPSLKERITIIPLAVSEKTEKKEFIYSTDIRYGKTSMNHLKDADTFFSSSHFKKWGFQVKDVDTTTLDDINFEAPVYLIKMDIEGAELQALQGALSLINRNKPILIIEVHSIYNMYMIYDFFNKINYKIKIIFKEQDGRCIIEAKHK